MRLEAKTKSGFYPLPIEAIGPIATKVVAAEGATLFDPCCGKGVAVQMLGEALGIPAKQVFGCEMDEGRHAIASQLLSPGNCHGPLDYLSASSWGDASIVYCNPPFDDELGGGGRVEWRFLSQALSQLKTGGVLIAILPQSTANDSRTYEVLSPRLAEIEIYEIPGERIYNECVVFGVKRKAMVECQWRDRKTSKPWQESEFGNIYHAPKGESVHMRKRFYSEVEIVKLASESKANEVLTKTSSAGLKEIRPPMDLTKGHIALLLASGCLDGVVERDGEEPHVVRGSSRKVHEEKKTEEEGKIKVTRTEQIHLTVKVATEDGEVRLLSNKIENEVPEETNEEEEMENAEVDC